jgi:hypothetical protein
MPLHAILSAQTITIELHDANDGINEGSALLVRRICRISRVEQGLGFEVRPMVLPRQFHPCADPLCRK